MMCWTAGHYKTFAFFCLPGTLLWGVGFPLLLGFWIRKNSHFNSSMKQIYKFSKESMNNSNFKFINQISSIDERRKNLGSPLEKLDSDNKINNGYGTLSFFYKGYHSKTYYWESLILFRKFFLCIFLTLKEAIVSDVKWIVIQSVLFSFLFLTIKLRPYITERATNLEIFSLICIIFSGFADFATEGQPQNYFTFGLTILTLAFNVVFLVYAIAILFYYYFIELKRIKEKIKSLNFKSKISFLGVNSKNKNEKKKIILVKNSGT